MTATFDHKTFLAQCPILPGVYQMLGEGDVVLYVGKARNLKRRLSSYFQRNVSPKTRSLMKQVKRIEVTVTTENEALLLEYNLIKRFKPRYNVLLRDSKGYPYIYVSTDERFPRIDFYRGQKQAGGRYFGPYPSPSAVRETVYLLQKIFRLRKCEDNVFNNRIRPCLQYQIKRCTAPCVNYIDEASYQQSVQHAIWFLEGKNQKIIDDLVKKMDAHAVALEFEKAAQIRNQIAQLRKVHEKQHVSNGQGDVDAVALVRKYETICIHVVTIRHGYVIGNRGYFPTVPMEADDTEILSAFLSQYYLGRDQRQSLPKRILINLNLSDSQWLAESLSTCLEQTISIHTPSRGSAAQWLQMAATSAEHTLKQHLAQRFKGIERLHALQDELSLEKVPVWIECFDISHTRGEATVASCVVFQKGQPAKQMYRRFNITGITEGDDYAAMYQVLYRRYKKLKEQGKWPEVVLIDGGKGQLHQAEKVFEELELPKVTLIGVAKGVSRKPGLETLFISGHEEGISLEPTSSALHLIQEVRDEAHRFAITGHRQKRNKARTISPLESIPGVGTKRRRELLRQLGGLAQVRQASIDELAQVPGISKSLAERIFTALRV